MRKLLTAVLSLCAFCFCQGQSLKLWESQLSPQVGAFTNAYAAPTENGKIFVVLESAGPSGIQTELALFEGSGNLVWRTAISFPGVSQTIPSSPVVDGDEVVFAVNTSAGIIGEVSFLRYNQAGKLSSSWPDQGHGEGVRHSPDLYDANTRFYGIGFDKGTSEFATYLRNIRFGHTAFVVGRVRADSVKLNLSPAAVVEGALSYSPNGGLAARVQDPSYRFPILFSTDWTGRSFTIASPTDRILGTDFASQGRLLVSGESLGFSIVKGFDSSGSLIFDNPGIVSGEQAYQSLVEDNTRVRTWLMTQGKPGLAGFGSLFGDTLHNALITSRPALGRGIPVGLTADGAKFYINRVTLNGSGSAPGPLNSVTTTAHSNPIVGTPEISQFMNGDIVLTSLQEGKFVLERFYSNELDSAGVDIRVFAGAPATIRLAFEEALDRDRLVTFETVPPAPGFPSHVVVPAGVRTFTTNYVPTATIEGGTYTFSAICDGKRISEVFFTHGPLAVPRYTGIPQKLFAGSDQTWVLQVDLTAPAQRPTQVSLDYWAPSPGGSLTPITNPTIGPVSVNFQPGETTKYFGVRASPGLAKSFVVRAKQDFGGFISVRFSNAVQIMEMPFVANPAAVTMKIGDSRTITIKTAGVDPSSPQMLTGNLGIPLVVDNMDSAGNVSSLVSAPSKILIKPGTNSISFNIKGLKEGTGTIQVQVAGSLFVKVINYLVTK